MPGRQENNNIDEEVEEDKEVNNNIQDIYEDEICTVGESIPGSTIEASTDVTVALLQTNKTNNNHKTVKGLLDTDALSTFIKKEALKNIPHTLKRTKIKVQGR